MKAADVGIFKKVGFERVDKGVCVLGCYCVGMNTETVIDLSNQYGKIIYSSNDAYSIIGYMFAHGIINR